MKASKMLLSNNSIDFNDVLYILNKEINIIHFKTMENKEIKCRGYLFCLYILCKISPEDIGKECGVSVSVVYRWLRRFNIKRMKGTLCMDKKLLQHQYIELKLSPYEIGKMYGVNHSTIREWLTENKIPMRSRSEAMKIALNKPEVKRRQSDEQKRVWNDPDYRANHSGENHPMYGKHGEETPNWKENYEKVSLRAKHKRKRNELKEIGIDEPEYCPYCNKPKGKRKLHLMNIDHQYNNNLLDYYYICPKCHKGIYHGLAGLGGKTSGIIIKPIPNLINNLLKLKTREERFQLLKKVILKYKNLIDKKKLGMLF